MWLPRRILWFPRRFWWHPRRLRWLPTRLCATSKESSLTQSLLNVASHEFQAPRVTSNDSAQTNFIFLIPNTFLHQNTIIEVLLRWGSLEVTVCWLHSKFERYPTQNWRSCEKNLISPYHFYFFLTAHSREVWKLFVLHAYCSATYFYE